MITLRRILWLGALSPLAALAMHCSPEDAASEPYLIVAPTLRQPETPALGTNVVVQQQGGRFLRLKTAAGTHAFASDPAGSEGRTISCIPAPQAGKKLFFTVLPADVECALSVELLAAPPPSAGSDGGGGAGAGSDDCRGEVLDSAFLAVTTTQENEAETTGTAGDGGGKPTGEGGASAATGGAGGAGGAGAGTGGAAGAGGM